MEIAVHAARPASPPRPQSAVRSGTTAAPDASTVARMSAPRIAAGSQSPVAIDPCACQASSHGVASRAARGASRAAAAVGAASTSPRPPVTSEVIYSL